MAYDSDEIVASRGRVSGVFFVAPTTATAPTSASATLTGFDQLGFVSDAGIVQTINRETTKLIDMSGDVVKVLDNSTEVQYKLTPYQLTEGFLKLILGDDNVTVSSGALASATINSDPLAEHIFVFDMVLTNLRLMRVVVPRGVVTATGDMTFAKSNVLNSELTIDCLPDSDGNKAYYYWADQS